MNIDRESRNAFFRRIHKVVEFQEAGRRKEWPGVQAYIDRHSWADEVEQEERREPEQLAM